MEFLTALLNLLESLWDLILVSGRGVYPYLPLFAWIAFWLLAVNWEKLYPVFWSGGWVGITLLVIATVFLWGILAPPETTHNILGLEVSNYIGKFLKVAALVVIAFLCGTVQLSGACACCVRFEDDQLDGLEHGEHGHDSHGDHHSHGLIADHH